MTNAATATLEILADPDALARRAADWLLAAARAKAGRFVVALSGGSTPRQLYHDLARPPYRDAFPWARTHWFWGDERFVPRDDAESNYRMAWEAMLSQVPIAANHIHAVPIAGLTPDEAAAAYERDLKSFYGADHLTPERPLFDVTFLGLGLDGHTASLFPGASVLAERERWVAAVMDAGTKARVTLTYPTLESTRRVAFLIAGEEKRDILARLRHDDDALPAARLHPAGTLCLFADTAAAGGLS